MELVTRNFFYCCRMLKRQDGLSSSVSIVMNIGYYNEMYNGELMKSKRSSQEYIGLHFTV